MIANFNNQTSLPTYDPSTILVDNSPFCIKIVNGEGEVSTTTRTLKDHINIILNHRTYKILIEQEKKEKEELNKQKPKIKWYNEFKKQRKNAYFK